MNYSDGVLFFAVLAIYSAQSILFCMLITTVFNRPVLAVVVTVIRKFFQSIYHLFK
jgi:hypothetical protein